MVATATALYPSLYETSIYFIDNTTVALWGKVFKPNEDIGANLCKTSGFIPIEIKDVAKFCINICMPAAADPVIPANRLILIASVKYGFRLIFKHHFTNFSKADVICTTPANPITVEANIIELAP